MNAAMQGKAARLYFALGAIRMSSSSQSRNGIRHLSVGRESRDFEVYPRRGSTSWAATWAIRDVYVQSWHLSSVFSVSRCSP